MKVEIGAEAALFPEKEYINGIAVAVYCISVNTYVCRIVWRAELVHSGEPYAIVVCAISKVKHMQFGHLTKSRVRISCVLSNERRPIR